MRALPLGPQALLIELDDQAEVHALCAEIERRRRRPGQWPWPQPRDVVPAARTVLIDGVTDPRSIAAAISGWRLPASAVPVGPLVLVPTVYDGPDLEAVAAHWGLSRRETVELHVETEFIVGFLGFAPGFAYLTGLPAERSLPRRASPRPRVPAGSVALAGEYGAVYPAASPGGWQLIGRTALELWNTDREPAALLAVGTRVRFGDARC